MQTLYIGLVIGLLSPIVGIFTFRLVKALPRLIAGSFKDYFVAVKTAIKVV